MKTKNYIYATWKNNDKLTRKIIEFYLEEITINTYEDTINFMNFIDYYNFEEYVKMTDTFIKALRKQSNWHKYTKIEISRLQNKLLKILIK